MPAPEERTSSTPSTTDQLVNASYVARTAIGAASTGTAGGMANRLIGHAAMPHIDRAAQAAARRFAQKHVPPAPKERLTGWGFWAIVAVSVLKDSLDILVNLTVVFAALAIVLGLTFSFIILTYFYFSGVGMDVRKIATAVIAMAVEIIPFLSALPVATVTLFIIRWFEQKDYKAELVKYQEKLKKLEAARRAVLARAVSPRAAMGQR